MMSVPIAFMWYTAADCNSHHTYPQEVDLAIAADLGTLQRLPSVVGHGERSDG